MLMFALKQYIAEDKVACLSATVTASKIIPFFSVLRASRVEKAMPERKLRVELSCARMHVTAPSSVCTLVLVDITRLTAAALTRIPELCKLPLPNSVRLEIFHALYREI